VAAFRQYENGRWAAVVRRKGYRPQCKAFATHSDAKRWANQIESEIDRAVFVDRAPSERASIQGLIDRYVLEVLPAKKSAATLSRILRFVCRHFGGFTLATLQPKHIAAYRDSRLASGTAGATIVKELGTLSRVVDVAVREWGFFVPANPFKLISSPNVSRGRERRLTGDEESRLLDACRRSGSPMLGAIVRLALETGMRLGELLSLTWANIDTVKRTARLGDTKNGESRAVPLSTLAISTLISLPRNISSGRVFWTWSRPDGFENAWRRALGKAGIFDEADQLPSAAAMQVDMEILANVFNEFHITVETAEQAARDLLTRKLAEPEHKAAAKLVLEILADPAWYHSAGVTEDGGIAVHHKMPGLLLKRVANLGNTAFVSATLTLGGSFADFKRALGIGKESALSSTIEPVKHGELRFVVNDEHEVDTPEWMTAVLPVARRGMARLCRLPM